MLRRYGIAVLTLLLGWQLGVGYTQKGYEERLQRLQAGFVHAGSGAVTSDPEEEVDISLLWNTWRLLNQNYTDPSKLTSNTMVYGAVEGLVRSIGDPYTVFMTPKEDTEFRQSLSGKLQGIGAELSLKDGFVTIVSPLKGSPAEKAGLLPEDVIAEVDDVPVDGLELDEVVQKVRGAKGTSVKLTLARKGRTAPIIRTIVRDEIRVPSVDAKVIQKDGSSVGYASLNQFGEGSIEDLTKELQGFKDKKVKAVILDLRFNGGGYLDGAVDLVSLFLRQGLVVSVQHRRDAPQQHFVSGNTLLPELPLVVLQNEGSASASEIVSGALQDQKRATIVGKKSFGKGTVQEILGLPDGSSLRVTVARWLTPSGKDLGKEGVHPDIEVERTAEDYQAARDPQLDAALAWLLHGTRPSAPPSSATSTAK